MKRKLTIAIGLIGIMSVSVMAKPVYQEIKATFNSKIQYELDGEEVLEDKGGLVYQDKVYLPVRDIAEALDIDVDYKDGKVILSKPIEMIKIQIPEVIDATEVTESTETMNEIDLIEIEESMSEAFEGIVTEVDIENQRITIVNQYGVEVILNVSDETSFLGKHGDMTDKRLYTIEDIEEEMMITGEKSRIETLSFPAQSSVYVINIEF